MPCICLHLSHPILNDAAQILSVDDEEVNQSVIETVLDGAEEDYEYVYAR